MQVKCTALGFGIGLYCHNYKLATDIDENGHRDRNSDYEIKR